MGLFDIFRVSKAPALGVLDGVPAQPLSPWSSTSNIASVAWAEHFQLQAEQVNRATAMSVPPISRARNLIVGSIADLPFVIYDADGPLDPQPDWVSRTSGVNSIWSRWASTLDDLLFYGVSLWARNNDPETGLPIDFAHVPAARWGAPQGVIQVDGKDVNASDVLIITGPGDALLNSGADTIRGARAIQKAWIERVQVPIPATLFQATEPDPATPEEINELLTGWDKGRRSAGGGASGYLPHGLTAIFPELGDDSSLFIEGRNAVRLDVANLTNIPASLLDGSTATASLTYVTQEGQKSSFHEQSLRYWMAPIEHRLSMDDVLPKGQYGRFDITYTTQVGPEGETAHD